MRIGQTIAELGLEKNAIAVWSEPTAGQRLKPKHGTRHLPSLKKPLYAILIFGGFFLFRYLTDGDEISFPLIAFIIVAVAIAWPLVIGLDRLHRRNVWIYVDRIIITHAQDRVVLPKAELKQVFLYRTSSPDLYAMELLLVGGRSSVVGLPNEVALSDLVVRLKENGYSVNNDL